MDPYKVSLLNALSTIRTFREMAERVSFEKFKELLTATEQQYLAYLNQYSTPTPSTTTDDSSKTSAPTDRKHATEWD